MVSEKGRNTSRYGSASRRAVASGSRPSSSGEQAESRGSSRVASNGGSGNRPSVFQRTQASAAMSGYDSKTASAFNRNRVAASRTARDDAFRSFELLSIRKWWKKREQTNMKSFPMVFFSVNWILLYILCCLVPLFFHDNSQFFMYYYYVTLNSCVSFYDLLLFVIIHDKFLRFILQIHFVFSFVCLDFFKLQTF